MDQSIASKELMRSPNLKEVEAMFGLHLAFRSRYDIDPRVVDSVERDDVGGSAEHILQSNKDARFCAHAPRGLEKSCEVIGSSDQTQLNWPELDTHRRREAIFPSVLSSQTADFDEENGVAAGYDGLTLSTNTSRQDPKETE